MNPEDYPSIHKMAILADVAPYSREYNTYRQIVGKEAEGNTELEIEYQKILNRVKQTRESVIKMTDRHFTAPVDEISGTIEEASPHGIKLKEYPGRIFQFSSVSTSAADMSARILGEDQVSSSFRTQKPSRVRDRSPSSIRWALSPGPLRSWLAHPDSRNASSNGLFILARTQETLAPAPGRGHP